MMMKKSLLTILCVLLSTISWAQGTTAGDSTAVAEPYAVLSADSLTVTFYYDNQKSARGGMDINNSYIDDGNSSPYGTATMAVFDASFANYLPTSTAYWFQRCNLLTEIRGLSNLNSANVTNMRFMFDNCSSLTNLDMSGFNTTNVTDMVLLFAGCSALTSLDLSGLNTTNVTEMNWMFDGCSSLTSLDVSGFNTANVTNMSGMFHECSSLTSLDLSGFNTANVTNMSWMFERCSALTNIYVSSTWTTSQVTANNGSNMFNECVNLVGGAGTTFSADHTDYTYAHIDGGSSNPGYFTEKNASYNEAYAVLVSEDGGNIMYATLYYDGNKANHTEGFAVVGLDEMLQNQAWMMNRSNIKTVNFDESFANCNPTSTAYWFAFCNSLTAINGLQYLNTEYVTNMEYMFHMCPALTSIDLSHFRAKSLTNMNSMFGGCSSLTSLDLSGFFTFTVTNMNYLFSGCTNLKTIYVNKYDWSTESVTAGDGVFENCTSLVGGAGTTFNDSHIDYTYARIDGGPNSTTPGYFTDIDASASVVAPEFRFEGDNLAMTTETQNASIFYKVAELPSMAEAVVDSVKNSLVVTPDGQQSTYYEHPFELKMNAVVKAIAVADDASGTIVSEVTTMVYDYEAWMNLKAAVTSGVDLYDRAKGNPNVDAQLLEDLQWALNEGDMIYNQRAQMDSFEAKHFTQRINELCAQIEAQMTPTEKVETPYFRMESDYNNEVAIKTDTDEAEIFYTQNSRMIQGNDTDFGFGDWNLNWKVSGSNASYQVTSGGYNNTYCLKLTSATASTFGSAQAGYKFVSALTKDTYYTLRFKARSESGRGQLQVFCQNDTIDNTRSTVDTIAIGSELTDYEVTFKIKNENTNQIVLNFGAVADTYYIDNVLFGAVVSDTTNQKRTRYEQPINLREGATIKAVATKQGMLDSSPAVLDYFYDGWMNLRAVYEMAGAITNECYGDPNVPLQMVQEVEVRVADRYSRLWDRRGREHVDDTELMDTYDELRYILDDLYRMKSGFTVDGVSYHAVDSTQVEVIPSLESYYRGAITVPATVNYNNINFRVTTVAQNAFRSEYLTAIIWNAGFALTATDLQSSQNPNLLLFVTEASMAPTDRDNVVINGFAKNIRLSEGGNFYCPQAFTAEAISYTREFKQQTQIGVSRGWETIALPFTVQTITHEQRGVIAPFGNTASNTHFWLRRLTSNGLQAVPTIEANTAYLISMPNSEEYVADYNLSGRVTFSAENATVPMTEIVKDESADYVMTPCFTNAAAKQGIYVLNVGEQRSGYPEGSIFESNYRAVLPFQAYVEHKGSNPAPPYFIVGDLGGDTTGIMDNRRETITNNYWYTLDGRKLQGKPTQKGVYITNGKKVIIK